MQSVGTDRIVALEGALGKAAPAPVDEAVLQPARLRSRQHRASRDNPRRAMSRPLITSLARLVCRAAHDEFQCSDKVRLMTRFVMAATAAVLLGCSPTFAQVSPGLPPLGMTSPLGVGTGSPVPPVRVPLGATELASPGVSPMTSITSALGPAPVTASGCRGIGGSIAESSFGLGTSTMGSSATQMSSVTGSSSGMGSSMSGTSSGTGVSTAGTSTSSTAFDGGGMAGSASGTCPSGGASLAGPAASASSPTGMGSGLTGARVGIPMGSTELGAGGLSPVPAVPTTNPSMSTVTTSTSTMGTIPCPTTGLSTTTATGMPTSSGSC
jgi:hypothetical protein